MGEQKLKPCPFCGSDKHPAMVHEDQDNSYRVVCNFQRGGCGSSSGFVPTDLAAAAAWNDRAKIATPKRYPIEVAEELARLDMNLTQRALQVLREFVETDASERDPDVNPSVATGLRLARELVHECEREAYARWKAERAEVPRG